MKVNCYVAGYLISVFANGRENKFLTFYSSIKKSEGFLRVQTSVFHKSLYTNNAGSFFMCIKNFFLLKW